MIIEGGSRRAGSWWAGHLENEEKNERVELVEIDGLKGATIPELFRELYALSRGDPDCKNYFYQYNIDPRKDERLTDAQWKESHEMLRGNLGLEGQPGFRVRHTKRDPDTGAISIHEHGITLRIDLDRMKAIPDSLTARIHEQTSRQIEEKFGLAPGRSILTPNRDEPRPPRGPKKWEQFRGIESGLDPAAIGKELASIKARSDNGRSFTAGIEATGKYVLAPGDRRDFVVIDLAGHERSLGRRLGIKAAELRAFMKDVDPATLPTIEQAKAQQRARAAEVEQRKAAIGRYDDIRPEATARAAEHEKPGRPAAEQGREDRPASGPPRAPQPEIKPLGKTAGEIRLAWQLTTTAAQFEARIEDKGLILVHVSRDEAENSWRAAAFAKAIGRQNRALREGFAVVDQRGNVTRIEQRNTGSQWEEIQKRLGGVDKDELPTVAQAKEIMAERRRAEWLEKKQAERAQERINEPVIGARAEIRAAWMQSRDGDPARDDGAKLEEALAVRGFAMARVTAAEAYESERISAFAKEIGNRAPVLKEGEIVAVNGFGHGYRFDERSTGQLRGEIDARLAGIEVLPSVAEARAAQREASRAEWIEQKRDEEDKARPATAIEQRILDCREMARLSGAQLEIGGEAKTVHGTAAFAARLDQAGLAIVRITASDIESLAELRADENLARGLAYMNGEAYRSQHFAEGLEEGDIAAVTRRGDVYQLNPHRLDLAAIAASLESPFRDGTIADSAPLPSMADARVAFLIERNAAAALREEARTEAHEAWLDRDAAWDAERATLGTIAAVERDTGDIKDAAGDMVDGAAAGIGRAVEKMVGLVMDFLADMIAPAPPPTREQAKAMRQDAEFKADLAAWSAEQTAPSNQQDEARRKQRAAERETEEEARRREWRDRDRERERER
jgi:hypothetical protein